MLFITLSIACADMLDRITALCIPYEQFMWKMVLEPIIYTILMDMLFI